MDESNIIQFSAPRTGSTLLFQVLSDLFPSSAISKAHEWHPDYKNKIVIGTFRDPRAVAISYWRVNKNIDSPKKKISKAEISKFSKIINNQIESMQPYIQNTINHEMMLFLKYELFYNDFDYLFQQLESFFNKTFESSLKERIKEQRSVLSNKNIASGFKNFRQYDKKSLIHGKHIYKNGESGSWKDFIKSENLEFFEKSLDYGLKTLGYK